MSVEPIRPEEVATLKIVVIPDEVIHAVNVLIAKNYSNGSSTVYQREIIAALEECGISRSKAYDSHYLDFEEIYRAAGWKVKYDKPGYNETYDAYFRFTEDHGNER